MQMKNLCGHLRTVRNHRRGVLYNCIRAGIPVQGLLHDLSKYSPTEFFPSVKYYQGTRSPNEQERIEKGYSEAWMHHKGRNKHHFEYWTDYSPETKQLEPVKMPLRYVAEMFCDRVAASKTYNGEQYTDRDPLDYFLRAKPRRKIHPETSRFLEILLKMLVIRGEEFTFAWLNWYLKTHQDY